MKLTIDLPREKWIIVLASLAWELERAKRCLAGEIAAGDVDADPAFWQREVAALEIALGKMRDAMASSRAK